MSVLRFSLSTLQTLSVLSGEGLASGPGNSADVEIGEWSRFRLPDRIVIEVGGVKWPRAGILKPSRSLSAVTPP